MKNTSTACNSSTRRALFGVGDGFGPRRLAPAGGCDALRECAQGRVLQETRNRPYSGVQSADK